MPIIRYPIGVQDFEKLRTQGDVYVDKTRYIRKILYQSGYLTIKSYDPSSLEFRLKYPNYEVARGFLRGLLPAYSGMRQKESTVAIKEFERKRYAEPFAKDPRRLIKVGVEFSLAERNITRWKTEE